VPLSPIVSFPVSAVPEGSLSVVGLNVTDTWQFPPAAIDDPHEFAITVNGAGELIEKIFSATMFGFVIVTLLAAETDPNCTLPNPIEIGE
jgi:hypothetical protein